MKIHITTQSGTPERAPATDENVLTLYGLTFKFTGSIDVDWTDGRICDACLRGRDSAEYRQATKVFAFAVDSTAQPRRPQNVLTEAHLTEKKLQEVAEKLGVRYYASFKVLSSTDEAEVLFMGELHFPMAEIYEKGRWRPVVIGGRPYRTLAFAHAILEEAKLIQAAFLNAMGQIRGAAGFPPSGLTSPLDHLKPFV